MTSEEPTVSLGHNAKRKRAADEQSTWATQQADPAASVKLARQEVAKQDESAVCPEPEKLEEFCRQCNISGALGNRGNWNLSDQPSFWSHLTNLELSNFAALGSYAPAAKLATEIALQTAYKSFVAGRIPIAGAAVQQDKAGRELKMICKGCNGRVPADGGIGYPTDHGETAALRNIPEFDACDWSNAVFATTLSPCIMCTRSLIHLHSLGLRRIVVAESSSFSGGNARLAALPDMQLVELSNPSSIQMMKTFARAYPWDWAADIGEIPPVADRTPADPNTAWRLLAQRCEHAAVVAPDGSVIATAADQRSAMGGNPVESAAMRALGLAGSTINLRDHTLVIRNISGGPADMESFGLSSVGACELFRPLAIIFDTPVAPALREVLEVAGCIVRAQDA